MSFYNEYRKYKNFNFENFFAGLTNAKIENILAKNSITLLDYLALISPLAKKYIEPMAQKAREITMRHFGKSILMYTPLYLSDHCLNTCLYCGFGAQNAMPRKQLDDDEIKKEARKISTRGIKHILILTGDAPQTATYEYILACVEMLKKYFSAIGIEIYACDKNGYQKFVNSGVDSLTIYQETYNEKLYSSLHPSGPKKDYIFRLNAPEEALKAGMRGVNIGALLGINKNFRADAFFTAQHAQYLQDKFLDAEISVSFPRICKGASSFKSVEVSDIELAQVVAAFRIFMQRAGITLSTREKAVFRNNILPFGITKMSAGCETSVGGYSGKGGKGQFEMSDKRSVAQIKQALLKQGYQPVFKNWDIL